MHIHVTRTNVDYLLKNNLIPGEPPFADSEFVVILETVDHERVATIDALFVYRGWES